MNYPESLVYLNSFINYERIILRAGNRNLNLARMRFLLNSFGLRKLNFFPVLIAGTKGKGSTGYFLESILTKAGYSAGFYNSPHLQTPRERIRIKGHMITESAWADALTLFQKKMKKISWPVRLGELTYFEILTFLAIWIFHQKKMDIGIFEVGLGGRLDATNVLNAPLSILTTMGYDHEKFLGNTLTLIAGEKAAIMRNKSQTVVAPQAAEAMKKIRAEANRIGARLYSSGLSKKHLGLQGQFQRINAGAAGLAAELLAEKFGFVISEAAIEKGLKLGHWPGRYETVKKRGLWILDAAHNLPSIRALLKDLARIKGYSRKIVFFAVAGDKRAPEMLKSLSLVFDEIVPAAVEDPRAWPAGSLAQLAAPYFKRIYPLCGVNNGFNFLRETIDAKTLVLVTGSFHLVGAVRQKLLGK